MKSDSAFRSSLVPRSMKTVQERSVSEMFLYEYFVAADDGTMKETGKQQDSTEMEIDEDGL